MPSTLADGAGATRKLSRRFPLTAFACWFLMVFLVLFPKGGFKIAGVPLTWGYMFLGLTLPVLAAVRFFGFPLRIKTGTLVAVISLVPFQLLLWYSRSQFGFPGAGILLSVLTGLVVLPWAFFLVYPAFLDRVDGVRLARILRFCILATAIYGIALFISFPITRDVFGIPYLTVNADDYGLIAKTKHIDHGFFLKLISTYNNGNLYGVSILMLLPLYRRFEPRLWRRSLVQIAMVLTLSRTVWFGLIVDQALSVLRVVYESALTFPRVSVRRAMRQGLLVVVTVALILTAFAISSGDLGFLFDSSLGGRSGYFAEALSKPTFLPGRPFIGFLEVIYATALGDFGILGFVSFLLIFVMPVFLLMANQVILSQPLRFAAFKGLVLYAIVAWIDGGLLLIPVLAFYWFIYMVFLEGWPGGEAVLSRLAGPPAAAPKPRRRLRLFAPASAIAAHGQRGQGEAASNPLPG